MRLSAKTGGLTHHIVAYWNYAGMLNGNLACGWPWPQWYVDGFISAEPATCLFCAISHRSYKDTRYTNEDA